VLPVQEDRIAATERLTFTRLVNQEALAATHTGNPLSGKVSDTNLPRESVGQKGRRAFKLLQEDEARDPARRPF
jgi:hypothetical protein